LSICVRGHHLQAGKKTALGDLQSFDTANRTWTLMSDSDLGKGPSARSWHSMCTAHHGIFLFGGAGDEASSSPVSYFDAMWVFNPVSNGWHNLSNRTTLEDQDPSLLPKRPNARAAVAMGCVTDATSTMILVCGGIAVHRHNTQTHTHTHTHTHHSK
jgi:hypothetical protein